MPRSPVDLVRRAVHHALLEMGFVADGDVLTGPNARARFVLTDDFATLEVPDGGSWRVVQHILYRPLWADLHRTRAREARRYLIGLLAWPVLGAMLHLAHLEPLRSALVLLAAFGVVWLRGIPQREPWYALGLMLIAFGGSLATARIASDGESLEILLGVGSFSAGVLFYFANEGPQAVRVLCAMLSKNPLRTIAVGVRYPIRRDAPIDRARADRLARAMPTYEYACTSCRRHFDVQQSFSDPPLETCEVCGGQLKRVFHPVGIVLKGSGFYATDNRSGKKFTPASKEPGESKSDSKSGSKSESKSGSKSETTGDTKGSKSDGGSATSD